MTTERLRPGAPDPEPAAEEQPKQGSRVPFPSRDERERRRTPRYRYTLDLDIVSAGATQRCHTADVSLYGAYVLTHRAAPSDTIVRVKLAQGLEDPIEWMGRVRHVVPPHEASARHPAGMGLEMFGASQRDWERWAWLIAEIAQRTEELKSGGYPRASGAAAVQSPRKHVRFTTPVEVVMSSMPQLLRFAARDVSAGGMFLRCSATPAVDSQIDLEVRHPVTGDIFSLKARVVRVEGDGVALEFIGMDESRRRALQRFIVGGQRPSSQ